LRDSPDRFNPAHRVRSLAELEGSRSADNDYRFQHESHGALYAVFLRSFVEESALDRRLLRARRRPERMLSRTPKYFLWVGGRRRAVARSIEPNRTEPNGARKILRTTRIGNGESRWLRLISGSAPCPLVPGVRLVEAAHCHIRTV